MRLASCLAVLLAIVAAVTVRGEMKTVFTIPLPSGPSQSEFYSAGGGDMYFTVGTMGRVYGVNLTSQKVQYTQHFDGSDEIEGILGLEGGYALVDGDGTTFALGPDGNLMWVSGAFALSTRKNSWTLNNGTLFVASDQDGTLSGIDIKTGKPVGKTISITSGVVFPTEAIIDTSDENGDNEVIAYEIPSFKQKWGLEVNAFLTQNNNYLLVSRTGTNSGETEVLVLNPNTLGLISTLKNCDGIESNNNFEIVNDDHFLAQLGYSGRIAYFDLTTGKMLWEYTPTENPNGNGNGGGFTVTNYSLVAISQTDLHFINITDGTKLVTKKDVPYTAKHTITVSGEDVQVSNLQGYTVWNAKTGDYVSRNEHSPSTTSGGGVEYYRWGKYYVSTSGDSVLVQENM